MRTAKEMMDEIFKKLEDIEMKNPRSTDELIAIGSEFAAVLNSAYRPMRSYIHDLERKAEAGEKLASAIETISSARMPVPIAFARDEALAAYREAVAVKET